ncbi:hypothetical protein PCH_Pc13g06410 [Penicillium rubens Wisconsin 54-1255]|uniref:Uncharacterized protein n=1 Tax=Penicillium rubens (strain ATCC 28089 / DSM 1075 / NRRL 1951 / Wisconsin 54-1255) TaxID=500485 RepID=B6H3H4_PENRW|nr:hypothetical protein PCH_Pc13g06410 [Penicillium rubens Wisconsin 54-1255]
MTDTEILANSPRIRNKWHLFRKNDGRGLDEKGNEKENIIIWQGLRECGGCPKCRFNPEVGPRWKALPAHQYGWDHDNFGEVNFHTLLTRKELLGTPKSHRPGRPA